MRNLGLQRGQRRLRRTRWPFFFAWLLQLQLLVSVESSSDPSRSSSLSSFQRSTRKTVSTNIPTGLSASKTNTLKVWETEVYNGTDWKGAQPSRWTSADSPRNPQCDPPTDQVAPRNYQFEGDWKIVKSADPMGWEYMWKRQSPIRRRLWLRSMVQVDDTRVVSSTSLDAMSKQKRQRKIALPLFRWLAEEWNFKGFGWTVYKSLLFRESCGFSFRVPLTINLDWWERHPELPSITSSIDLYYPWQACFFLSASLNVDYLKWCMRYLLAKLHRLLQVVSVTLAQIFAVFVSLPLSLLSQKPLPFPTLTAPKALPPPTYQLDISQRLGMSVSWRLSQARGKEFRVSYWHCYLPTLLYMRELFLQLVPLLLGDLTQSPSKRKRQTEQLVDWLRRHTGSLGISMSRPTPDPPHFSTSACLSMSGFHYGKQRRNMRKTTTVASKRTVEDSSNSAEAVAGASKINAQLEKTKKETDETEITVSARGEVVKLA